MQKQRVSKSKKSAPKSDNLGAPELNSVSKITASIAERNDYCRRTFKGCKILMTAGVSYNEERHLIFQAVQQFNSFSKENDPYGKHDYGSFTLNGQIYFWKFEYYDENYEYFKENGNRVLTIGQMDEY